MYRISEELSNELKVNYIEKILRSLPEWFELEEGIKKYIEEAKKTTCYISESDGNVNGYISVKSHNSDSAEILSMGVLKEYQGHGIGRDLVGTVEKALKEKGIKLLQVKTLGPSANCKHYEKTRAFYRSIGFYSLEENYEVWGVENPCLIMVKMI